MITVFTPTYNRANTLSRLYNSLIQQTFKDFEWLIVDDGSTDNTRGKINTFIDEHKISINYRYQKNGGKHRAINNGVRIANGNIFFIVDSDDYLKSDALKIINSRFKEIQGQPRFAGVCGLRVDPNNQKIGGGYFDTLDCSPLDFRYKYRIKGDMAEAFYTDVLRKYPFPEFDSETFCTEAIVWNRISQKYILRYFYEKIYVCEYRQDGLSASSYEHQLLSPMATNLYYKELFSYPIPITDKIRHGLIYWRCMYKSHKVSHMPLWLYLLYPAGICYVVLVKIRDFFRERR